MHRWTAGIIIGNHRRFHIETSKGLSLRPEQNGRHSWWRHQIETFSALLAIWAGNSPVPGEFPAQRPVTRSFDVFFDLRLNKRLSKQSWGWWFETLPRPLWRHSNVQMNMYISIQNSLKFVFHASIKNKSALVQEMVWPYRGLWWSHCITHMVSLGHNDLYNQKEQYSTAYLKKSVLFIHENLL